MSSFPLPHSWNYYFHELKNPDYENMSSYFTIMTEINSVEKVNAILKNTKPSIVVFGMLFMMIEGTTPRWEDPRNLGKGGLKFKVSNPFTFQVWNDLIKKLCGETLATTPEMTQHIVGVSTSQKKGYSVIKIWMDTNEYTDGSFLSVIENLNDKNQPMEYALH